MNEILLYILSIYGVKKDQKIPDGSDIYLGNANK